MPIRLTTSCAPRLCPTMNDSGTMMTIMTMRSMMPATMRRPTPTGSMFPPREFVVRAWWARSQVPSSSVENRPIGGIQLAMGGREHLVQLRHGGSARDRRGDPGRGHHPGHGHLGGEHLPAFRHLVQRGQHALAAVTLEEFFQARLA